MRVKVASWARALYETKKRYVGASGGRGGGKSHEFAQKAVIAHIKDQDRKTVCIREIQKSLKFSSKALVESKIRAMGAQPFFEITKDEIRSTRGTGIFIFEGMQDHTADSIKSLEGFDCAWVEEAQRLSQRSLDLLRPTIRKSGSQLFFTWNPDKEDDPVDKLFREGLINSPDDFLLINVNYYDNPFISEEMLKEEAYDRQFDPENHGGVY